MKISVVIVTCDRGSDIVHRTLQSVTSQSHTVDEIVIIDSGKYENRELKDSLPQDYPDVCYTHSPNLSAPEARNLGASMCSCDAICFLDDDDEWYPKKIEHQLSKMKGDVCLVTSPYIIESINGERTFEPKVADNVSILGENLLGATSFVMISKRIFDRVGGFDTSFRANQEWDLWMRMLEHGTSAISYGCAGIKHHSDSSISTDHGKRRKGWYSIIQKHMFQYIRNPERMFIASGIFMDEMQSYSYRMDALFGKVGFYLACLLRRIRK